MATNCETCRYEMAYDVQFRELTNDLGELKERVRRLESTLTRGMLLLVANLAGVVMVLAQELLKR